MFPIMVHLPDWQNWRTIIYMIYKLMKQKKPLYTKVEEIKYVWCASCYLNN